MSWLEWILGFLVLNSVAGLLAFGMELRLRWLYLREHPEWKPGESMHDDVVR